MKKTTSEVESQVYELSLPNNRIGDTTIVLSKTTETNVKGKVTQTNEAWVNPSEFAQNAMIHTVGTLEEWYDKGTVISMKVTVKLEIEYNNNE